MLIISIESVITLIAVLAGIITFIVLQEEDLKKQKRVLNDVATKHNELVKKHNAHVILTQKQLNLLHLRLEDSNGTQGGEELREEESKS